MKLAGVVAGVALSATAHADVARNLPVIETQLANGLRVILAPDPSVSSVVVDVRYGTGAADRPGLAHLVERLLFSGSTHVSDFDARIDGVGGWASSATTQDHTSVFEQVPASALELVLWLEAERMAGVADVIDEPRIAHARATIAAERHSAYEDHPSALVSRAVQQALWRGDPNEHLVVADDHAAASDVAAFARAMLSPGNATLVITGRFEPRATGELVRRYFSWIPSVRVAGAPPHASVGPLAKPVDVTVEDPIAKVVVAVRTDAPYAAGTIDLEVAARVLAGGRTSRLWRRLVVARSLATEVHADVIRQARGGEIRIEATARTGIDPASLGDEIRDEIGKLRDHEPSDDEITRAQAALESDLLFGLEGLAFRAETLAAWATYTNRAAYLDAVLDAIRAASSRSVQHAAQRWFAANAIVTVIGRPR